MTLADFIRLPVDHNINIEAGRALQIDICTKGITALSFEHRCRLHDYLENVLLHGEAETLLRDQLEAICTALSGDCAR